MRSVRILAVMIAGIAPASCTQVHELGQINDGAEDASTASTFFTETSSDSDATTQMADTSEGSTSPTSTDETTDEGTTDEGTTDTTEDASETEGSETGEPFPEACQVMDLAGNEGVTLEVILMTQWDAGACHEFHITNESPDDVIWTRDLRFGGTLDNFWNAEGEALTPTDWRFGGQASADNILVLSGETIIFGGCMQCTPP